MGRGLLNADGLQQTRQGVPGEVGSDAAVGAVRRQTEEVLPDALQAGGAVVTTVDLDLLDVVETALQVRSREEDRRFHARHGTLGDAQLARGPQEPALEVLRLGIVEVERVVDRPGAVGAAEVPGGSVVFQPPRMALDLDQVEARGHRDQQVALVDTARLRGEGECGPGAVRLGGRHQASYVVESVLLPGVRGGTVLEPLLRRTRRSGFGHRTRVSCRHRPTSAVSSRPFGPKSLVDLTAPR